MPDDVPVNRADTITHDLARARASQGAFLAAYAQLARVDLAAKAAEIGRHTHYDWLKNDPAYPALFAEAQQLATQTLVDEAVRRAYEGTDEPVFHQGQQCGKVRKYSDRLMERLLEWRVPEFKSRQTIEHTGKDGTPLVPLEAWDALTKALAGDGSTSV